MPQAEYIWTNHAYQRLNERRIPLAYLEKTVADPDRTIQKKGAFELQKKIDDRTVTALVKQNERGENIIVSCWVNPPFPGTKDFKTKQRYKQMQTATGFKKFWLHVLYQLGI
jgi:hypothetical protein